MCAFVTNATFLTNLLLLTLKVLDKVSKAKRGTHGWCLTVKNYVAYHLNTLHNNVQIKKKQFTF